MQQYLEKNYLKNGLGRKVINGDKHDLRHLDPKKVVVGLIAKGKAKKDFNGFVQDVIILYENVTGLYIKIKLWVMHERINLHKNLLTLANII